MLAHNGSTASACPDFQLVSSRCTEGIAGNQHHLLALLGQLLCDLADGGGLAHTVDTDHQNDGRMGIQLQCGTAHIEHIIEDQLQIELYMIGGGQATVRHTVAQLFHQLIDRVHAQIRKNQGFFQLIEEIIIDGIGIVKHIVQRFGEAFASLCQTLLNFFKKTHNRLLSVTIEN